MDKFESDKNVISRELATQTQKVVEAKLTIQQLHKLNTQLKSDLQVKNILFNKDFHSPFEKVALNLLQTKPSSFVPQRLDTLPEDLQARVRQVIFDVWLKSFTTTAGGVRERGSQEWGAQNHNCYAQWK